MTASVASSTLTPRDGRLTQTARDCRVEVGAQFARRRPGRSRQRTHHQPSPRGQLRKPVGAQVLELAAHSVAHDRTADLTPDHETGPGNGVRIANRAISLGQRQMDDEPRASSPPTHPHRGGEL